MSMSSFFESIKKPSFFPSIPTDDYESLPVVSHTSPNAGREQGLRRRLSSLSVLAIQPISTHAASWSFARSKSMSSIGESAGNSVRKWWDWGWGWIISRKPAFAKDLEMNEEESAMLGCHNKGTWRHVFYKVRSEFTRLVGSNNAAGLPYNSNM
ncbi:PREDICTED: uncharacterized protein LOC104606839 [Nelumbo nucifera]|uniref:Uncharacterized protein LOC104606839 n=2 Tax=Nelumbo nucifera TaxID=4432 RepID=A0A1U8AVG3_NELNU|nr:PREDICTED: uncharacterized protein LOC104606839 [Nelumbo nucifera]DAD46509.1 TPA_asm: hypothetical protein HUJ06_016446 [Nelumbo nucifera]